MNGCAHVGCGHDSRQEARSEERVRKDEIGNEILSDHVIKVLHRLCGMRATLAPADRRSPTTPPPLIERCAPRARTTRF